MVSYISTPWVWYLKLKHRLFGLMPLQGLVNKYHKDPTEKQHDPLWSYWLLLTYEAQVTDAIENARDRGRRDVFNNALVQYDVDNTNLAVEYNTSPFLSAEDKIKLFYEEWNEDTRRKADEYANGVAAKYAATEAGMQIADENEKQAYLKITAALRDSKNTPHNVKWRVFLHLLGLVVINFLMVGIAASNTMSLAGFLATNEVSFGPYTNIVTGFLYTASMWSQWMIFRRGITLMLKTIGGWDFFETRKLGMKPENNYKLDYEKPPVELKKVQGITEDQLDGYWSRRIRTLFYGACTIAGGFAWGVVVYSKLSVGFDVSSGGYIALSAVMADNWGLVFGTLSGFSAAFLWLTALRKSMKDEEKVARANKIIAVLAHDNSSEAKAEKGAQQKIIDAAVMPEKSWALTILIAVTMYALFASMLGQSAIVFDTMGWENNNHNPFDPTHPKGLAYFSIFLGAVFLGRAPFVSEAIEKLYNNAIDAYSATTTNKIRTELKVYRSNYIVGVVTSLTVLAFFAASLQYDVLSKPMTSGTNGHRMLSPMGIVTLSAMFVWTMFLVLKRVNDGTAEEADKKEAEREKQAAWFPSGAANGYETRTVNAIVAAGANGLAYGAIGGAGVQNAILDIDHATMADYDGKVHDDHHAAAKNAALAFGTFAQPTSGLQSFSTSMKQVRHKKP